MQQKRQKGKPTGEDKYKLTINKSLGVFIIGNIIDNYLHLSYKFKHEDYDTFSSNTYDFYKGKVSIWTIEDDDNQINVIHTIRCNSECYWKDYNLIGMNYENFIILAEQQPNGEDIYYVPISSDRGQNQKVYDFDALGLQIWVWRKKIKTILITNYKLFA
jgi:hypothetical protein